MMPSTISSWRRRSLFRGRMLGAAMLATLVVGGLPRYAEAGGDGRVTMLAVANDDEYFMQTWLAVPMRRYAFGMRRWLQEAFAGHGGRAADAAELLRFQQQIRRATFSHFQYTYTVEGVEHARIYLGVSGRPFSELINTAYRGARHLEVPPMPTRNYFNEDNVVSFGSVGAPTWSDVTPQPVTPGTPNRANDAEIKVLQAIMRDISSGLIPAGGRLLGFVSQQPCPSCHAAFQQFSVEARADVHINYVEGSPHSPQTMTPALAVIRNLRNVLADELTTHFAPPVNVVRMSSEVESTDEASTSMCTNR